MVPFLQAGKSAGELGSQCVDAARAEQHSQWRVGSVGQRQQCRRRRGRIAGREPARGRSSEQSLAGVCVGGVAIMAKQRFDVSFVQQSLFYPVTDAAQNTDSYRTFAEGPFLPAEAMEWFWNAYIPDEGPQRKEITASPLRASIEELRGLPPAFIIVDQNDVLRDEGEAYAAKLTRAGVPTTSIRYNGIIHDFMMLNPVRSTQAATAAIEQTIHVLSKALGTL
ncbi:alpha/beta hydrolase fold domain-containing protein [Streptomyces parvulus]|uniref:alpha/beta hydrolase fold domain-containing protein n=1 Tax=Streptomyces parvulus TaxID=146923 RepID=UPI0038049090